MIVHIQTVVQTVFGTIDEEGNVINKQPVSVEINKLDENSFLNAFRALQEARNKQAAGQSTQ